MENSIKFISSRNIEEEHPITSKSDQMEIMAYNDTN